MADIGDMEFDATTEPVMSDRDPIPPGEYLAQMTASERKPTSAGTGELLKCEFTVIEPAEHAGRKVWSQLNLNNPSQTAVQIARKELSSICHAVGVLTPKDSAELHDIQLVIKVRIRPAKGDNAAQNEITGYSSASGQSPPPPPTGGSPVRAPSPPTPRPPQAAVPARQQQPVMAGTGGGASTPPWKRGK